MSRILARALGGPAGPDPVLPRLPTRFEPGLEMASGPELVAGEPEAGGHEDLEPSGPAAGHRAAGAIGPAGRWSEPRGPADPRAGSPLAGPGSPVVRPVPGHQAAGGPALVLPAGPGGRPGTAGQDRRPASGGLDRWPASGGLDRWPASGGLGGWPGSGGIDGSPGTAGLARPQDAGLRRRERSEPAFPVRPASAIPELAEPPVSPDGAVGPVAPVRPADQLSAAAMSTGPARPDLGAGPGWVTPRRGAQAVQGRAAAEPAVHITIGQVEIRADHAAAGEPGRLAARPAGRTRRVAPDLSEYLQRRGQRR
jgi:hypothetical protein